MIGPTSETARAMMASLNGAIQKGMPPDQAIAYVKSQAMSGVAPLVDLFSLVKQFERMKQPKQDMPPGGTVREQMNQLEMGLGGLNAGTMQNPQFAGGGIIAFQEGGVPPANDPTAGLGYFTSRYNQLQEEAEDPSLIDDEMARREELRKKYGLGQYGELFKEQEKEAARMESELPGRAGEARRVDMAEFFFNIAAEASKPGATLLSSIAGAGPGFARQTRATKKELDALQKEAREARLGLLKANELERAGDLNAAEALRSNVKSEMTQIGGEIAKISQRGIEAKEEREFRSREAEKGREFQRELSREESAARERLEAQRAAYEALRDTGRMTPEIRAGLEYLDLAKQKGDDHPDTIAALRRHMNLTQKGTGLSMNIPGGQGTQQTPGVVDFSTLK